MKAEGTHVAYRNSDGQREAGTVVGYDHHLRYLIKKDGAGKFDALAVVTESSLIDEDWTAWDSVLSV